MRFQGIAKKPTTLLVMTGYHLEEFNDLLPHFTLAFRESKYTLEGKERQNQSMNYLMLEIALSNAKLMLSRTIDESSLSEVASVYSHDGVERAIQRPKKDQRAYYSGKNKTHTVKNNVVADASCTVTF